MIMNNTQTNTDTNTNTNANTNINAGHIAEKDVDMLDAIRDETQKRATIPDLDATIYLAGPVDAKQDGGAGWRNAIIDAHEDKDNLAFADPLDKYDVPVSDLTLVDGFSDDDPTTVGTSEIIQDDKELLRQSDAVLVGFEDVKTTGTPMEVMWSFERNYPVCLWNRDATPFGDISSWFKFHVSNIVDTRRLALRRLCISILIQRTRSDSDSDSDSDSESSGDE